MDGTVTLHCDNQLTVDVFSNGCAKDQSSKHVLARSGSSQPAKGSG